MGVRFDQAGAGRGRTAPVEVCDETLLCRGGSTFEDWTEVSVKRAQLLRSLERQRVRLTDELTSTATRYRLGDTTPTAPAAVPGASRCRG